MNVFFLTVAADAARRLVGPFSWTGAGDGGGSFWDVARVTAVHQQCPQGEGAPVGFRLVDQVPMLDEGRPRTTCRVKRHG